MRTKRSARRPLAVVLGFSLFAGLVSYVPEAAAKVTRYPAPVVKPDQSVKGTNFIAKPTVAPGDTGKFSPVPTAIWPSAASSVVALKDLQPGLTRTAGLSPVKVGRAVSATQQAAAFAPSAVKVDLLNQSQSSAMGIAGVVLRLGRADGVAAPGRARVEIDYSKFRDAYGGDWSSRLRLVELTCRAASVCDNAQVVRGSTNNAGLRSVTADVDLGAAVGSSSKTFALMAAADGPNGAYSASSLSPASTWQVSAQTGDFGWNYPLRVPPGTAGPRPQLAINYSSGSVDGQTASTNSQASWIGQGHGLEPGFIERKYVGCADDMAGGNNTVKTGDLCWKSDNATVSLAGHSSELLWDAEQGWTLRNDDGSKIQRFTGAPNGARNGEYWLLTTNDGTKYYFGLNPIAYEPARTNSVLTVPVFGNQAGEPCHATTFADSHCQQAWRWNLDSVVDPHGNVMTYRYQIENNNYGRNNNTGVSQYQRASHITKIEYAERVGSETTGVPPAWVNFSVSERCLPSGTITCTEAQRTLANAAHWPDVPVDQICTSTTTCPGKTSPTFFTTKRLTSINTQIWAGAVRDIDRWTLTQSLEDPGDGTSKSLWLSSITHRGMVGAAASDPSDPPVTFTGVKLPNRVDSSSDGAFPMNKLRMKTITTESGTRITVNYMAAECTPTNKPTDPVTNDMRCFPVYYTRDGGEAPTRHWFHKYPVSSFVEADQVADSPDMQTTYEYVGAPAWHYDDNELTQAKYRTWGDWRGYGKVNVRTGMPGSQSLESFLYFRGMHGDRANAAGTATRTVVVQDSQQGSHFDYWRLNGVQREQITYNGSGGDEVSGTISTPWLYQTGSGGGYTSQLLGTKETITRTRLFNGSYRESVVKTEFDALGLPIAISDEGDAAKDDDNRCTRHVYTRNLPANITTTIARTETVAVGCNATPNRPADITSDTRTYYDGNAGLLDDPTKGLVSKVETMSDWTTGPVYEQRSRTDYDALGRTKATYDGLDRRTSLVEYTPALDGPVTSVKTTDAKGFVSTTTVDPAWGSTLTEVDPNNKRTDMTYDASGRLRAVWLPDRSKSAGADASMTFSYLLSNGAPSVVASAELLPNGGVRTTRTLLDGLLRKRQVQTPGANGTGRLIVDTKYDARGKVATEAGPYYDSASGPNNSLFNVPENNVPAETVHHYDGANREIINVFRTKAVERWRTTTIYGGNVVSVRPPAGGTATTTIMDVRGKTTELREFHNGTTSGTFDQTRYTYNSRDQLEAVTNEAGSVWRYTYDERGRQVTAFDPDKGLSKSTYDAVDRLVSTEDARNQKIFHQYDELDRKTAVRKDSPTGDVLASWAYDTLGKGLLTSSTRVAGGNSYVSAVTGYDALDRPTGTRTVIPASEGKLAGTYTTSTSYNPDGSVKEAVLPNLPGLPPETLKLVYDAAGNLDAMSGWSNYMADVIHTSYGEPARYALASDAEKFVWQSFDYEEGTRRGISMQINRSGQAAEDDLFSYSYDPIGNLKAIAHKSPAGMDRQCFELDHIRRMTEAWTPSGGTCTTGPEAQALGGPLPYWKSFTYSASGNRTKVVDHKEVGNAATNTTSMYAYPGATAARPHALNSIDTTGPSGTSRNTYTYDSAGNLKTRTEGGDTDTFAWDPEGHLESVTGASGATNFVYDAEGSRLIKRDPTGATLYLPSGEVRYDKATDKASSTRYYQFEGKTIAMRTSDVAVEFVIGDHHGTAAISVDAYSGYLSRRFADPFGNVRYQSATWEKNSRGFVDGVIDSSTGLTHLGAREYDSKLGRFISVDPLMDVMDPHTLNGYAYANNNPATYSDPDGLKDLVDLPDGSSVASNNEKSTYAHYNESKKYRQKPPTVAQEIERHVSYHKQQKEKAKAKIKRVIKDLVKIVADELGVTDALNCARNGDMSSCLATGVTILTSFAGGIAGKLAAKYGAPWKWKKAAALIGRIKGLVGEAIDGIKGWRKAENDLQAAMSCNVNSFVPGTRILMADGSRKPIEQLKLGDKVVATDPRSGKAAIQSVSATIIGNGSKEQVEISIATRKANGQLKRSKIVATAGHPFYLPEQDEWIAAGDLSIGSRLSVLDGAEAKVVATRSFTSVARVHNLTISSFHTYYVFADAAPILVHNCGLQLYQAGGKHGFEARGSVRGENSAEPRDGQGALGNSVQIKSTSPRRVGVDPSNGDTVILDRTAEVPCGCTTPGGTNEMYHGHVRTNLGSDPGMAKAQAALRRGIKAGIIEVP